MVKNRQKGTLKIKFVPYMATRAKMFEMNILELNEFINELIASNPFVEEARFAPETIAPNDFEKYIAASEDMYSNLLHQLRMLDIDRQTQEIGEFIINSLNEEGYLTVPLDKIASRFNVPVKYAERALKAVQSLEPPGIGARNLSECLILQLEAEENISPKVKHVILKHLKELADEKYQTISKETGLKIETLAKLREKISHFTVSPGLAFKESKTKRIIVPDLSIVKTDEGFKAYLNEKFMRRFFINEKYLNAIRKNPNGGSLIKMADQAKWTLKSFLERREMLLKFGTFIAENEREFLSGTLPYPNKHTVDEISHKLKTDESSLSRLIQNKFAETPVGTFPLRYFVQHKSKPYNDEELKLAIKNIIEGEDKARPLTDEEISKILQGKGLNAKRRTVVKYRKLLGIPSSSKRRLTNR